MDITFWLLASKKLFEQGGFVMPPLLFCSILLWYALGYRYCILRIRHKHNMRDLYDFFQKKPDTQATDLVELALLQGLLLRQNNHEHLRRRIDTLFLTYEREIRRYSVLVKVIVMIAPLLGLLGTVSGMIETFDSLAEMALFTQSGGIAGGVSQALLTTQTGLAVAIPGVLFQSWLQKRQKIIETNLAQIKDLLCRQ